ncbi:MAG: hypothetical protein IT260_00195 [Saprospiraceae bacterium]|nr:hypothetical protein [Saprospiraceae bacterium]
MEKKTSFSVNFKTKNPVLSKKLTIAGSLLVLGAFIVQTFLYDKWKDNIDAYSQANRDFSEFTRTSLLYQNLYFNINAEDTLVIRQSKQLFMRAAAEKYRLGRIISTNIDLVDTDLERNKFIANSNTVLKEVYKVVDYESLMRFIPIADSLLPGNLKLNDEWLKAQHKKKEIASLVFLSLQIIGSLLLALGLKYQ